MQLAAGATQAATYTCPLPNSLKSAKQKYENKSGFVYCALRK